ncbi:MAG: GNAT family N-acetyltransferase [Pseudomonadota bacterium]
MIRQLGIDDFEVLATLLSASALDPSDLQPRDMSAFVGVFADNTLIAAGGLVRFGHDGWLRSMVTAVEARSQGWASQIVAALERRAVDAGIRTVFLLTDTATRFFEGKGYAIADRKTAPEAICGTAQFQSLCPDTADLMFKPLNG